MGYTQVDLDSITSAIMALATGRQVVSVRIGGKTIEYASTQLPELRSLREEIQSSILSAAGKRKFVLTSTSKGL